MGWRCLLDVNNPRQRLSMRLSAQMLRVEKKIMEAYQSLQEEVRHEQCFSVLGYVYSCTRRRPGPAGCKLGLISVI